MKLQPKPFQRIAREEKTIELRLNDEKRKMINVGDTIIFTNIDDNDSKISAVVVKLHRFDSFRQLYDMLPLDKCGYLSDEIDTASPLDMEAYYSIDKQSQYGVLGIEIKLS